MRQNSEHAFSQNKTRLLMSFYNIEKRGLPRRLEAKKKQLEDPYFNVIMLAPVTLPKNKFSVFVLAGTGRLPQCRCIILSFRDKRRGMNRSIHG